MAAVVAALLVAAAAAEARRWELRTIEIHQHYWMPPAQQDGPCGPGEPPGCVTFHGPTTIAGTIDTEGTYIGFVWPSTRYPGEFEYRGPNFFTATIPGCGTGSWLHQDVDGRLPLSSASPFKQSIRGTNRWTIEGTGGELAERIVGGGGTQAFDSYPLRIDPTDQWGFGRFDGEVICRVPVGGR